MATTSEQIAAVKAEVQADAATEFQRKKERYVARFKALSSGAARSKFAALLGQLMAVVANGSTAWEKINEEGVSEEESARLFSDFYEACREQDDIHHQFDWLCEAQPEVAAEGWSETFDKLVERMYLDSEA